MNVILFELLEKVINTILDEFVTIETKKKYGDRLFDLIEDIVKDSKTKIDDVTVLPIVKTLRSVLDIPDKPD